MEPKILVPVNDSPTAHATVDAIIASKSRFPRQLTLLYVINKEQLAYRMIPDFQVEMVKENAQRAGRGLLAKYREQLTEAGFEPATILKTGSPREVITDIANEDEYDLLVIGRHEGGGQIRDVLFGSVANFVLHNVKCAVLLF